jgi:hypothetical protein
MAVEASLQVTRRDWKITAPLYLTLQKYSPSDGTVIRAHRPVSAGLSVAVDGITVDFSTAPIADVQLQALLPFGKRLRREAWV